jgi:hypothetical protein
MERIVRLCDAGLPYSRKQLYALAQDGKIPGAFRLSAKGAWLIDLEQLTKFVQQQQPSAAEGQGAA